MYFNGVYPVKKQWKKQLKNYSYNMIITENLVFYWISQ